MSYISVHNKSTSQVVDRFGFSFKVQNTGCERFQDLTSMISEANDTVCTTYAHVWAKGWMSQSIWGNDNISFFFDAYKNFRWAVHIPSFLCARLIYCYKRIFIRWTMYTRNNLWIIEYSIFMILFLFNFFTCTVSTLSERRVVLKYYSVLTLSGYKCNNAGPVSGTASSCVCL